MREMLNASWRAFLHFSPIAKMANHREDVPLDAWYAAKIVATMAEDCGPCTQLMVTMAEREGMHHAVLRAIVDGNESAMGPDVALAVRFTRAVLAHGLQADPLRKQIDSRWGERAVMSLALVIAGARVFPTVRYALGHGQACARVRMGGVETKMGAQASNLAAGKLE
jgi:hypothetical protein